MSRIILITGGSSGIGKSIGEFLNIKGYKVFGTSRTPEKYNDSKFPIIKLKSRINEYNSTPIIINAVNEILVDQYLKKKIAFNSFYKLISYVLKDRNYKKYAIKVPKNINQILLIDKWSRDITNKLLKNV